MTVHRDDDPAVAQMRQVMREEIESSLHPKRNGDPVVKWLLKKLTFDRVIWILAVIVMVVDEYRERVARYDGYDSRIAASHTSIQAATTNILALQNTIGVLVMEQEGLVLDQRRLVGDQEQLREELKLTVTRPEFQSALRQQILPRLERIEKALAEAKDAR